RLRGLGRGQRARQHAAESKQGAGNQKLQKLPAIGRPRHYLGGTGTRLFDPPDCALRVRDVHDDSPVLAAVELDRHCLASASNVPELPPGSPIEGTGGDGAPGVRSRHAPAPPPALAPPPGSSHPPPFHPPDPKPPL